jgi:hypothetical protein
LLSPWAASRAICDQANRVRAQPAAHTGQHLTRGGIQPVHVFGDNQDRRPPGLGGQQLQGRQPDQLRSRSLPLAHTQGSAEPWITVWSAAVQRAGVSAG